VFLTSQSVQPLTRHKACQRGCEWRARISREVLRATEQYLTDQCGEAPTAIAEYVGELLEGARYMWETHDALQPSVSNQHLFTFRISNTLL
jgi:hypothetical protein